MRAKVELNCSAPALIPMAASGGATTVSARSHYLRELNCDVALDGHVRRQPHRRHQRAARCGVRDDFAKSDGGRGGKGGDGRNRSGGRRISLVTSGGSGGGGELGDRVAAANIRLKGHARVRPADCHCGVEATKERLAVALRVRLPFAAPPPGALPAGSTGLILEQQLLGGGRRAVAAPARRRLRGSLLK